MMRTAPWLLLGLMLGCGGPPPTTGTSVLATPSPAASLGTLFVNCAAFAVSGEPTSAGGSRWTYTSVDAGQPFALEGVLFEPEGAGPFPAAVVSHGAGGLPSNYSAAVARTMVTWGLVVIATRYTHAADFDLRNALLLPAGPAGASEANVSRAHKARDLLSCRGRVDLSRVAAHGHSMGAFVTGELVGTYPADFRAASHTAGGTSPGPNATQAATASRIRTPYQLHHGDADRVVSIAQDESLDAILTTNGVPHELHRYAGYSHEQMALDPTMLERIRDWYTRHGVLR
jgi:dienelactone hydrolase